MSWTVTDYRGHHQTLLPLWHINLKASATNNTDAQVIWSDWELNRGHVSYCCQVVCTMTLPLVPLGQPSLRCHLTSIFLDAHFFFSWTSHEVLHLRDRLVGMRGNSFFYFGLVSVRFLKKTLIQFRMNLVRYKKTWLGLDIIVFYYLCNSWVDNLQQILQQQWMTWLWRHSQQWQHVNNVIAFWNVDAKLCFSHVLKRSLSAHLMQVKLLLFTFYLNGGLYAVSIGKPSERMSNFWTVRFLKTEFWFSTHPYCLVLQTVVILVFHTSLLPSATDCCYFGFPHIPIA